MPRTNSGRKSFPKLDASDFKVPGGNLALANAILSESSRAHADIPLDRLLPNPRQPRKHFDEAAIAELAADIKENGLIEEIVVRESPSSDGFWEVICGERRKRACQLLGWERIPAQIRIATDAEMLRIAIAENDQRERLSPYERALAYEELRQELSRGGSEVTVRELAAVLNKNKDSVQLHLNLLKAQPELLQWAIEDATVPLRTIDELRRIEDETVRRELMQLIREKIFNQDEVIAIAQQLRRGPARTGKVVHDGSGELREESPTSSPDQAGKSELKNPVLRLALTKKLLARHDRQVRAVISTYQNDLTTMGEEERFLAQTHIRAWIADLQKLLHSED
ncbi:MAG TPA: ParB/RepB/Spo0J family partition protein [Ktedonobacteraceae bacterium]|nr:ParB/RepB/Spo0J family partition protein [Ktedonobacteraceae bacterium]